MHAWPPRLPTLQGPQPAPPAPLAHCLLLAALLHLWLVVVLGNAAGGTAEPGQGVWGAINIRLRGPVAEAPPTAPQPPVLPGGAPGQAAAERWGGAVRSPQAQAHEEPGAEKLGHWGPQPQPAPTAEADLTPARSLAPVELPVLPAPPEAQLAPARPAPAQPTPAQPTQTRLRAALPEGPAPVEALPANPAPLAAPRAAAPALAAPLPALQAAPLRALPAAAPPRAAAEAVPALPPAALEPAAAPLPEVALPQNLPQSSPVPPAAAAEPVLRPLEPATPLATPLPAAAQAMAPAAQPAAAPPALPTVPAALAPAALPAPAAGSSAAASLDAGGRVGHDVATPASNAASVLPRLNLELARPRGGELSRGVARGALPVLPRPPELDDKLARDIEKAAKTDCRKAYAGTGLLAVVPLAADALGKSGGCKW